MAEKRRLLDFVFSNSTWAGGRLTPNYRKPFDLISEAVKMQAEEEARTGAKFDKTARNENWLTTFPFLEIDGTFYHTETVGHLHLYETSVCSF